jgi:hypothetical protein
MGFTNSHIIRLNLADAEELEGKYWLWKFKRICKKYLLAQFTRATDAHIHLHVILL